MDDREILAGLNKSDCNKKLLLFAGVGILAIAIIALALVLIFNLCACGATKNNKQAEPGQSLVCTPLLYEVTDDDGNTLYLFGSIHVGDERMEEMPTYVLDAYEESDFLAVEADVVAFEQDFSKAMELTEMMLCADGKSIEDYLGEELFADLKEYLTEVGEYSVIYEMYGPAMWDSLLEVSIAEESGLDSEKGADRLFLEMAKEEEKEIREVESVEFQYDMMLNFSDELYQLMIRSTLDDIDGAVEGTRELYEVWLSGDEDDLKEQMEDDLSDATEEEFALYEVYKKAMLTDRNQGMFEVAKEYMEEGKNCFFVVGAAHVVGDDALAELFGDAGYEVSIVSR